MAPGVWEKTFTETQKRRLLLHYTRCALEYWILFGSLKNIVLHRHIEKGYNGRGYGLHFDSFVSPPAGYVR